MNNEDFPRTLGSGYKKLKVKRTELSKGWVGEDFKSRAKRLRESRERKRELENLRASHPHIDMKFKPTLAQMLQGGLPGLGKKK